MTTMPCSPAQLEANRKNGARSEGPKTDEGKARSRANSLKHGLTGEGVVLPEQDVAEVDRLTHAFHEELKPTGETGHILVRRMAVLAVRMERSVDQETAALSKRVRQALDDFEAPEGADDQTLAKLRAQAGSMALFDASPEAKLARRYEAAAERGFFRALQELRELKKTTKVDPVAEIAAHAKATMGQLGSFLPAPSKAVAAVPTPPPAPPKPLLPPTRQSLNEWAPFATDHFDVPIMIGKRR